MVKDKVTMDRVTVDRVTVDRVTVAVSVEAPAYTAMRAAVRKVVGSLPLPTGQFSEI